ncbi:MAG: CRISPR-associated endonuclease/helicase Cas3, partial [Abditibacteriota bacterium]|nr:CRISPR-associated endonuclease/helicase Cas3 [Abditibacteriota bacterium]
MSELYRHLWAKSDPHHFLWCHLLDVAAVSEALYPRFGLHHDLPAEWAYYLCALHDIGKADPWFQNKADDKDNDLAEQLRQAGLELPQRLETTLPKTLHFRHEARSREWLQKHLRGEHDWDADAASIIATAINGHHGDFSASCYSESELPTQRAAWQPLRAALARQVWDVLQPPTFAPQEFRHAGALGVALSGLIILSDWIASNHELYKFTTLQNHDDTHDYWQHAREEAARVVREMKLDAAPSPQFSVPPHFGEVWPKLSKSPRPSQSTLEAEVLAQRVAPGLAIIEAPMGEGKTEAAI